MNDICKDSGLTRENHRPPNAMFTAKECAAIRLRVPASGNKWLDKMITESRTLDGISQRSDNISVFEHVFGKR